MISAVDLRQRGLGPGDHEGDTLTRTPKEITDDDQLHQLRWRRIRIRFADDVGHPIERESVAAATERQVETGRLFGLRIDDRIVARLVVSHAALGVVRIGGIGLATGAKVTTLCSSRKTRDPVVYAGRSFAS